MMKRLQYLIAAFVLVFQTPVMSALALDTEQQAQVLANVDFEGNGASAVAGICASTMVDEEHGVSLRMGGSEAASAQAYFTFPYAVSDGRLAISYDVFNARTDKEAYVRVFDGPYTAMTGEASGHFFEAYIIRSNGNFQMFNNTSWDVTGAPARTYEANKWYHIDMWFDFAKRTATYYIDGEILGSTTMADALTQIQAFVHVVGVGNEGMIDNVHAVHFKTSGINMEEYGYFQGFPSEILHKVVTAFHIPVLGNAYFGKEVRAGVKLSEGMGEYFEGSVTVTLYGEDGRSLSQTQDVMLSKNEEKELDFTMQTWRFGFYDMEAVCRNKNGEELGRAFTRISVITPNEEPNPKMGFSTHITKGILGYGFDRKEEKLGMAKNAGAGFSRDELRWTSFEAKPGMWGADQYTQGWMDASETDHMRMYATIGYGNPAVINEAFPHSKEAVDSFLKYVSYVAEETKNLNIDYEFWNEYNIFTNTYGTGAQEYVDLLKEVYKIFKAANPKANVYAFTTANSARDYGGANKFIEDCLKLGAGDYLDGISIHPYNVTLAPDTGKLDSDVNSVIEIMDQYGIGHKKLMISEFGWTSSLNYANEELQANYTAQACGLLQDRVEGIVWYNLQEKSIAGMSDPEQHFGFIRGWADTEIPFEAKPVLLTFSAYNSLMRGSKKVGRINHSNENTALHRFQAQDGKTVIMGWSKNGDIQNALQVGCDRVTVYDRYGNGSDIKTRDGVLDILLTEKPVYIIGDMGDVTEAVPGFKVIERELITVKEDQTVLHGMLPGAGFEVEVECPDNISVLDGVTYRENGAFEVPLATGPNGRDNESVTVIIRDAENGETVYRQEVPVKYSHPLTITSSVKYYKNAHWQLCLKLVNNKAGDALSGKIVMTAPDDLLLSKHASVFEHLEAGGSRYVYINIPPEQTADKLDMTGYAELSSGERIPFSESSYFVGLMRMEQKPVINGVLEDGEYVMTAPIRADKESMIQKIENYGGAADLSGTVYLNYDAEYFYLAARVRDNVDAATDTAVRVWANDSIQFAFAEQALASAGRTEIGIGKDHEGNPTIQRYAYLGAKFFVGDIEGEIPLSDRCELGISRQGDITTYELKMPWSDIYGDDVPVFTKRSVLFSIIINDNDGNGRRGWMEFCPGIGGAKNAALFMKIPVAH